MLLKTVFDINKIVKQFIEHRESIPSNLYIEGYRRVFQILLDSYIEIEKIYYDSVLRPKLIGYVKKENSNSKTTFLTLAIICYSMIREKTRLYSREGVLDYPPTT